MILSGKATLAGVMGWPVSHSLSPRLHGYWLGKFDIDGAYLPLPVSPQSFSRSLRALPLMGFSGVNVTLPHKMKALSLCDVLSDEARKLGAVNTIVFEKDGRICGHNTDAYGFIQNLKQSVPDWDPASGPVVVLGAGGAARAVCMALQAAGVGEIRLTNRTPEKAKALVEEFKGPLNRVPWKNRGKALKGAALLVNATSLGMKGMEPLDIDLTDLEAEAVVTDVVYTPLQTPLLRRAGARGNRIVDGLGMLLHQARPAFEAWFNARPEVDRAVREFVLESK